MNITSTGEGHFWLAMSQIINALFLVCGLWSEIPFSYLPFSIAGADIGYGADGVDKDKNLGNSIADVVFKSSSVFCYIIDVLDTAYV